MRQICTLGLICPEPLMLIRQNLRKLPPGGVLQVICDDPATQRDLPIWCHHFNHRLTNSKKNAQGKDCFLIQKGKEHDPYKRN